MVGFRRTIALTLSLLLIISLFTYSPLVNAIEPISATIGYDRDNLNAGDIFYKDNNMDEEVELTSKTQVFDVTTTTEITVRVIPAKGYKINQTLYDDNDIDMVFVDSTSTYIITPNVGDTSFIRSFQFLIEFTEEDNISQVRTTSNVLVSGASINCYRMDGENILEYTSYTTTTDINGMFNKYEILDDNWYLVIAEKDTLKSYTITDKNSPSVGIVIPSSMVNINDSVVTMDRNGIKVDETSLVEASHFYIEPLLRNSSGIEAYGFPSVNYANEQLVALGNYYNDSNLNNLEDNQKFVVYYLEETKYIDHSTYDVVGYQVETYDKPIVNRVIDTSGNIVNGLSQVTFYNISNPTDLYQYLLTNDGYFDIPTGLTSEDDYVVTAYNSVTPDKLGYDKLNPSGMDIVVYNISENRYGGGLSEISMGVFTDENEGSRGEVRLETRSSIFPAASHFDAHVLFDGWSLSTHGLPTPNNIGSIGSPDNIDIVPVDGETYKVMILYYNSSGYNYDFIGYDIVDYTYEDNGPGGPGGPSTRTINFKVNGSDHSIGAQRDLLVYVPVSEGAISIEFLDNPDEVWIDPILPVMVDEMEGNETAVSTWLREIGATVSGSSISFEADNPLKRITAVTKYEGDEYRIVFMQPGYDDATIDLNFREDGLENISIPITNEEPPNIWRQYRYKLPVMDSFQLEYQVTMATAPEVFFTGVLEYNVDRDAFVSVNRDSSDFELITANRGYGSVKLHCQYHLGNSWEDAFVVLYEEDFFTLDIQPDIRIADWESGVTNLSKSWIYTQPVSYVYFMNSFVSLRIPDYLVGDYLLTRVSVLWENIPNIEGTWTIPLGGRYDEDTVVDLEIQRGEDEPYYKQLVIRKTALSAQSGYWGDYIENPNDMTLMTYIRAYGSDAQPEDMRHPEDIVYPTFDIRGKVIVVNYYNNDRIIGTKEFVIPMDYPNYDEMSFDRKMYEVKVYDEFDPEFMDVRDANRVSSFLLNTSLSESYFNGARFGFGSGWGHLLPTHPDWGSGKDGMEFERGGSR